MLERPALTERFLAQVDYGECVQCDVRTACLAGALYGRHARALDPVIRRQRPYRAGQIVYRKGAATRVVYVIERGSVKLETVTREGRLVVNGFLFAGELLGADAMDADAYPADAIALEETRLCALPLRELERLCARIPELHKALLAYFGRALRAARYDSASSRLESAATRTLAFLRELRARQESPNGGRAGRLYLPMTKQDIASYLWMSPECLSRSLKKLEREGHILSTRDGITVR
jgi:CRP/FNR family transcriptional regulator